MITTLDSSLPVEKQIEFQLLERCAAECRIAAWQWHLPTGVFDITSTFYDIFELPKKENPTERKNIIQLLKNRMTLEQMKILTAAIQTTRKLKIPFQKMFHLEWGKSKKMIKFQITPILEDDTVTSIIGLIEEYQQQRPNTLYEMAKQTLDKLDAMVFYVTENFNIKYVNAAACLQLGYSKEMLLEKRTIFQLDAENSQTQWKGFIKKLNRQKPLSIETSFQRKDGTILPVEGVLIAARRPQKLYSFIVRDITTRRTEEAHLKAILIENNSLSQQLKTENTYLKEAVANVQEAKKIISQCDEYQKVLHLATQVAPTDATVLIEGETGTGKELLATLIHEQSLRQNTPFVKVNCSTLSPSLVESELFGHERGAFTGAVRTKQGRFELADKGTIFLDEIGELSLDIQIKLLRVLQEGEFQRVGGTKSFFVNVRVIAATNRDLKKLVEEKKFREDLYYRLNVFPIYNIPLRERKDDIPLLVDYFIQKYSRKIGRKVNRIKPEDLNRFTDYDFPGNVRELENIIERGIILSSSNVLNLSFWHSHSKQSGNVSSLSPSSFLSWEDMQRQYILSVLKKTEWRVSGKKGAAQLLKLHPQTLFSKMRKLGIEKVAPSK